MEKEKKEEKKRKVVSLALNDYECGLLKKYSMYRESFAQAARRLAIERCKELEEQENLGR